MVIVWQWCSFVVIRGAGVIVVDVVTTTTMIVAAAIVVGVI